MCQVSDNPLKKPAQMMEDFALLYHWADVLKSAAGLLYDELHEASTEYGNIGRRSRHLTRISEDKGEE